MIFGVNKDESILDVEGKGIGIFQSITRWNSMNPLVYVPKDEEDVE